MEENGTNQKARRLNSVSVSVSVSVSLSDLFQSDRQSDIFLLFLFYIEKLNPAFV